MVSEKARTSSVSAFDGARKASLLDSIPHRGKKRSLANLSTSTRGSQNLNREETEASLLLSKASISKHASHQSESARLLNIIPDLNQKEMSRLVSTIIRKQKRDASSAGRKSTVTRDRPTSNSIPVLFPEKQSELLRSQSNKETLPARSSLLTRGDAIRILKESKTGSNLTSNSGLQRAPSEEKTSEHLHGLTEELIQRASQGKT